MHLEEGPWRTHYVYIILMEYCESGDLTDLIVREDNLSQFRIIKYLLEIGEGVKYIHSRDIIHQDIKSPNIFINNKDEAKLGDFGLCVHRKKIVSKVRHSSAD